MPVFKNINNFSFFILNLKKGFLFRLFLALLFTVRFLIEFIKENQEALNTLPINMGQILSIPFILIGLYFIFRKPKDRTFISPVGKDKLH